VSDRWSETVFREVKVDERAAHEDSGGMDLLVERVLALDKENTNSLLCEQARTLKTGESRADDSDVIASDAETSTD
jgi:hypothetical protein